MITFANLNKVDISQSDLHGRVTSYMARGIFGARGGSRIVFADTSTERTILLIQRIKRDRFTFVLGERVTCGLNWF